LLAQNDLVAIGAMDALQEAGIAIPDDVSIVGFNGTEVCDLVTPRLTSLAVPLREIGALGMETLLGLIGGQEGSRKTILLSTHLDERLSVRRL
jgi:LacI family transcriptional regulator